MRKAIVNISRIILAATLIFSGFVKAVDPSGTQYKIADYFSALLGVSVPDFVSLGASVVLSAIEFTTGICLLFAIRRRLSSSVAMVFMLVMTPMTLWLAIANPVSDCGCFGDAVTLTNWQTFFKNVVLLLMALIVWRYPFDMMRFISRSNQWIVINYSIIFILAVSGWSLYDLPYFDFRPYHTGTNLRQGWQQTMEGKSQTYADFFVERLPSLQAAEREKADGQEAGDITEHILNETGYTFLLVSPHLEQADDSHLDLINEIYEYADDNGYSFYCLTASGRQGIADWCDATGAEYPFCQTDDIVLKTVIRSNPGLLLLKDGIIIRKWSHNRFPDEYALNDRLENIEIGHMPEDTVAEKLLVILSWYVLPLLLLTLADRLWAWTHWLKRRKKKEGKADTTELSDTTEIFTKITNNNEKENCSRQLEDEPEPAGGCSPRQGTE